LKIERIDGPLYLEGRQTKPQAARAFNLFLNEDEVNAKIALYIVQQKEMLEHVMNMLQIC
jgi:hypothetical protein